MSHDVVVLLHIVDHHQPASVQFTLSSSLKQGVSHIREKVFVVFPKGVEIMNLDSHPKRTLSKTSVWVTLSHPQSLEEIQSSNSKFLGEDM